MTTPTTTLPDFAVYAHGLLYASVCVSKALTVEEVTARLNAEAPTGIASPWQPAEESNFAAGQPNPCPCDQSPATHLHRLFSC